MDDNLKYKIALSLLPGIGSILARNLVAYAGSVEAVFSESKKALTKIPGIGEMNARLIKKKDVFPEVEKEMNFIEKHQIGVSFYTDADYPRRLKNCIDSPVLVYSKGNLNLNEQRVISIVGTRNATTYGKQLVEDLIKQFSERNYKILIVSGLAYGIDIQAHRSSLKNNIPTVGIIAHGLNQIYPSVHKETAKKMLDFGGLLTEFPSTAKIDPSNFVKRNRIIAGLADATLVVESAKKGGALITADIASSYNRDVFAFPGNAGAPFSSGCNQLIRNNGATLIEGIEDLEYFMGWEVAQETEAIQSSLFVELKEEEQEIVNLLRENETLFIDQVATEMKLPVSRISTMLLQLEFKNILVALPGKMYKLR